MEGKKVKESRVVMTQVMTPQDVNVAGNVHGGVIMKLIDEAGGSVAIRHTRGNAVTASIDHLDFHHPVFIGDLVTLRASVNLVIYMAASHNWWKFNLTISYTLLPSQSIPLSNQCFL